jgi:hypothetical protein
LRLGGKNWNAAGGDLWARLQWRFVALFNTMAKDPSSKEKWIFLVVCRSIIFSPSYICTFFPITSYHQGLIAIRPAQKLVSSSGTNPTTS